MICSHSPSKISQDAPIILFLNKIDLLKAKLDRGLTPAVLFPEYKGGTNQEKAIEFIKKKFLSLLSSRKEGLEETKEKGVFLMMKTRFGCGSSDMRVGHEKRSCDFLVVQKDHAGCGFGIEQADGRLHYLLSTLP